MSLKLFSYNVNGIRAAVSKGFDGWLKQANPDVISLQETKVQEGQIDPLIFSKLGYHLYWHYAVKKGYSGVAVFTKMKPLYVEYGMGMDKYDSEGRVLRVDFDQFSLVSAYFPSGTTGDVRQEFKMEFLAYFQHYINNLKKEKPNLIISGDYNICHKAVDINHPERHTNTSGFLPEERAWFDGFIENGFIDSFREFNKGPGNYSWWSYRAQSRIKNLGWRIDYHLLTLPLKGKLKGAMILKDVSHSDHCPVTIEMDF